MIALALHAAAKSYAGCAALRPVSLSIPAGQRVAVVGPSGAGKSTLLRLLNSSLAPSAGRVEILGSDVAALSPRALRALRARVGTIYQHLHLVPQSSVMQNVVAGRLGRTSLARALLSLLSADEAERVRAVLDRVGIAAKLHERVDRLSGGEQQRVAIARTLHQDPEVVLADEPLASIDPTRAAEIVDLMGEAFVGRTFIVSTHRLEPLLPHVDRVLGLRDGELLFDLPSAKVTLDDLARLYASRRGAAVGATPSRPAPAPAISPGATVRAGASSTPGEMLLPGALRAFARAFPGVRVTLALRDSAEIADALLARRVDVGFVGARGAHPGLLHEDFADDEIVLVAAPGLPGVPDEPIGPAAAARLPRVDREVGSGTRAVVEDHFSALGAPLDASATVLEAESLAAQKAGVLAGLGVAFLSRLAVLEEVRRGRLRVLRVEGVRIPRSVFVAWRAGEEPPPAARAFVDVARATLAELQENVA